MTDDKNNIINWQKTHDPMLFANLSMRYRPIINSVVSRYRTTGLPPSTLRAIATTNMIKAFETYDPTKGTEPSTHLWNHLQRVQRSASESLLSGHIPENRNLKKSTFNIVTNNLTDQLGREPSIDEMADELGWDQREVARMQSEMRGEVNASDAEFDFYGNSTQGESKNKVMADYLYHELKGPEKIVFERTFGYGNKPILNNKEISEVLNINEMAVHRMKKKMADKIRSYQ